MVIDGNLLMLGGFIGTIASTVFSISWFASKMNARVEVTEEKLDLLKEEFKEYTDKFLDITSRLVSLEECKVHVESTDFLTQADHERQSKACRSEVFGIVDRVDAGVNDLKNEWMAHRKYQTEKREKEEETIKALERGVLKTQLLLEKVVIPQINKHLGRRTNDKIDTTGDVQ